MSESPNTRPTADLPVLISGAGPCGLVAALVLQQHGVPFRVLEKASRGRLCSNAGSGFDLAVSAVDVLTKIGLKDKMEKQFMRYDGLYVLDMQGNMVRTVSLAEIFAQVDPNNPEAGTMWSAGRSDMQNICLDALKDQENVLQCGASVASYVEEEDKVTVTLSDGSTVEGSALLACDGIRSAVRKQMFADVENDTLSYCGQNCWWAKTPLTPELEKVLAPTQVHIVEGGTSCLFTLSTHRHPGFFFAVPVAGNLMWGLFRTCDETKTVTNDLTHRGGFQLDEAGKTEMLDWLKCTAPIIQETVVATPPESITFAGIYDRTNTKLPYTSPNGGRVALLGDASHPQSPMMGQGVNMAIVDAYVLCARLAKQSTKDAIMAYDTTVRRKGVNKVVKSARDQGNATCSGNRFICWTTKMVTKYIPMKWTPITQGDDSNAEFLAALRVEFDDM